MMKSCFVLVGLILPGFVLQLAAEADIQRYLSSIEGYRFVIEQEKTSIDETVTGQYLNRAILEEAGFTSYSSWQVIPDSGPQTRIQIHELVDTKGAFQLLSHWPVPGNSQNSEALDLPIRAHLNSREGVFWRGKFFFRVTSSRGGELLPEEFSRLVKLFYRAVTMENRLPVSITHLPDKDIRTDSVRLYLGEKTLQENKRFPAPLLRQIGLEDKIEIAYAEYGENRDPLFLVGYPTVALAKDYVIQMQESLQDFFSEEGVYIKRTGVLVGIFPGPEDRAMEILNLVNYEPEIQWLHEEKEESRFSETMTFLGLITQTILGIGVFLILILGTGLSFGLVRYEILRRFPKIFRKDKMVRLELDPYNYQESQSQKKINRSEQNENP
jgi:hypothetical protein